MFLKLLSLAGFGSRRRAAAAAGNITLVSMAEGTDLTGSTFDLTLTGTAAGDVVYVLHGIMLTAASPSGYTEVATLDSGGVFYRVSRKVLTGADATVTIPTSGNAGIGNAAIAYVLRGVNNSTPEDATATTDLLESDGNANPAITTVTNNAWVLLFLGISEDPAGEFLPPTGYGNSQDAFANDTLFDSGVISATKTVASAGVETPGPWLNSGEEPQGNFDGFAFTVAVRPA